MATRILKKLITTPFPTMTTTVCFRRKTSSAQYVASRARDPTFEKLMHNYKNLLKVIFIQDLILSNPLHPTTNHQPHPPPSLSIEFLNRLSQKLHLNRGATAFLRKFPHVFQIFYHPTKRQPFCTLTPTALELFKEESQAIAASIPLAIDCLIRLLSMSLDKTLPLRAIFKVYKELGLPDDFENTVILKNSHIFALDDGNEINTHTLKLVKNVDKGSLVAAVENWRVMEYCNEGCSVDRGEIQYSFKHTYPPGMRLKKNFKANVREWQRLPYIGPYEEMGVKRRTKAGMKELEKRAVGIVHEFLSLTVEKMVEVEKISHFRKWFGIDLNIRDLFLDHPGMFYLSTKGKRHTVFLREAYERGRLIEPNPIYDVRRKLFDLVVLGRRGLLKDDTNSMHADQIEEDVPD